MKRVLIILGAVLLTANIFGQEAQTMNYQAEIRNINNDLVASSPIGMKVSILQGFETGMPVMGTISGIDWSKETIFLKAGTDPSGGANYSAIAETLPFPSEPSALVETHYVGEFYGGGIVFYVDEEGEHGLIASTVDKSVRKRQKNEKHRLSNDAQVVENYQDPNLGEWYLPTRYDLIRLYNNRAVIGGYADFSKGWKSTKSSSINEWFKSFVTGGEFRNGKDDVVYVRIIRKF